MNRPVRLEEVDLFSPSVAPAKKLEVAQRVAELERRAREEARNAEAAKNGDVDLADALKKLDTLRDKPALEPIVARISELNDLSRDAQDN